MQAWTDYPITELGDRPHTEAPIRRCEVIGYDHNKYVTITVEGRRTEVKRCYVYPAPGRCGDSEAISDEALITAFLEGCE